MMGDLAFAGSPTPPSVTTTAVDIPLPYRSTYSLNQDLVRLHMNGTDSTFDIPRNYIDIPGRFGKFAAVKNVLLLSLLPGLAGREAGNERQFAAVPASQLLAILLNTPSAGPWDMARVEDAYAQDRSEYGHQQLGVLYGLTAMRQVPPNSGRGWHWKYVLWQGPEHSPSVSIVCDGEGTVPYPSCVHHFLYKSLLVQLSYAKTNLPQWDFIQQSVRTKLDEWAQAQP
ncbi:hypothetical protein [Rhizobium sp. P28RR-XV]|uniref:hypothetical protein n=1 Tax=Rhizobium sp. P28RR-XV TaxID=2726737 RepID=UPI0014568AB6|nr:hypothetical protein [Rhizobium sp. P28RR-XV]NLR89467.1 hypothetical protein [Rhizobium sp. P28RR-XV]